MIQPHTMTYLFKCGDRKKLVNLPERRAITFRLIWLAVQTFDNDVSVWCNQPVSRLMFGQHEFDQCNHKRRIKQQIRGTVSLCPFIRLLPIRSHCSWTPSPPLGCMTRRWAYFQAKVQLLLGKTNVVLPLKNELCYLCRRVLLKQNILRNIQHHDQIIAFFMMTGSAQQLCARSGMLTKQTLKLNQFDGFNPILILLFTMGFRHIFHCIFLIFPFYSCFTA